MFIWIVNKVIGEHENSLLISISAYAIKCESHNDSYQTKSSAKSFRPCLPDAERQARSHLGIDSHADVSCIGKHARNC